MSKEAILESAKEIFLEQGYSGASISQIAKGAGVAKSLVFHHYKTKEDLWRAVKEDMLAHLKEADMSAIKKADSVESLIETIVARRFQAYEGNPELARLVSWQLMEENPDKLLGIKNYRSDSWDDAVKDLQKRKLINPAYAPDLVCVMIYGAISNVFFDNRRRVYKSPKKLKAYRDMVTESLVKALRY